MPILQCLLVERVIGLEINKEVQNMEIQLKLNPKKTIIELDHRHKVGKALKWGNLCKGIWKYLNKLITYMTLKLMIVQNSNYPRNQIIR